MRTASIPIFRQAIILLGAELPLGAQNSPSAPGGEAVTVIPICAQVRATRISDGKVCAASSFRTGTLGAAQTDRMKTLDTKLASSKDDRSCRNDARTRFSEIGEQQTLIFRPLFVSRETGRFNQVAFKSCEAD
jgi:hypothetical protein